MSPRDDPAPPVKKNGAGSVETVDPLAVEIWQQLLYTFNALVKIGREVLKEHGISGPQYGVLRILQRRGPSTMTELSEELLVTAGNVTGLVDRLVRDGLVERQAGRSDRRVVRTRLTDAGRALVEEAAATHHRFLSRLLDGSSEADKKRLLELLEQLHQAVQTSL
jgi:DNA-binding MarR family transcriptional regulator